VKSFDLFTSAFPYRPTLSANDFIDEKHRDIAEAKTGKMGISICIDIGIEGYLLHGDAMKLYEMAALGQGDILELGTHRGLSTSIMAEAISNRDNGIIETVDIDLCSNIIARDNITGRKGAERVNFVVMDATRRMDELIRMGRKFGFVFIDHWHGYEATYEAAERLDKLLLDDGYVLFHDALDPGNADPNHPYGVFTAIEDTIGKDSRFTFFGNFGCCSLYHFKDVEEVKQAIEAEPAKDNGILSRLRHMLG